MSSPLIPIETAELEWRNGLPYSKQFQDIYFSEENGFEESRHVFIKGNGLLERWQTLLPNESFVIAETGFGTGLNFLVTWHFWLQHAPHHGILHFISCEKFPLRKNDLEKSLALWPELAYLATELIQQYPVLTPGFHALEFQKGRVKLTLMLGDGTECFDQLLICRKNTLESQLREETSYIDAWYLDGFSQAKNEALWTKKLFEIIGLLSKKNTTAATFSAAGSIKENLIHSGFSVKKIKGFGRKKEMLTGVFTLPNHSTTTRGITPWHANHPSPNKKREAIIIGAGLAGCFLAFSLAKRGFTVQVLDAEKEPASYGSGNSQAIFFPKFSAYRCPMTEYLLASFLYALRFYKNFPEAAILEGLMLLAYNEKEAKSQKSLKTWLESYPELAVLIEKTKAEELAGISLPCGGLFIPNSGWIDSPKLCRLLLERENIHWHPETSVGELSQENGLWQVAGHCAEIVIIANGCQASQFSQTSYLPIKTIRGQMTRISATAQSSMLKIPVCGTGHVLPVKQGSHWIGASYDLGQADSAAKSEDDVLNIKRLQENLPHLDWSTQVKDSWSSVRATTADYLPLVGPIVNSSDFLSTYAKLSLNSNLWIPQIPNAYPGLYVCAGFGSRGLTTIPLAAEFLASLICKEPYILPRSLVKALSPSRFLMRQLVRG